MKPPAETGFTLPVCKLSLSPPSSPFLLAVEPDDNLELFYFFPLLQINLWTDLAPAADWPGSFYRRLLYTR
jgi:hypothetical protein